MKQLKFLFLILFLSSLSFSAVSCKKGTELQKDNQEELTEENIEQSVSLDKTSATLAVGEELTLKVTFGTTTTPKRTYQWATDNSDVVSVAANNDYSAKVTAKAKGTANVSISSTDGELTAICTIIVEEATSEWISDGVIRILAIGNSFSQDAVETYLYELAEKEGIPVVIGNLYIGGASLNLHWNNANENLSAYSYRKIAKDGNKTTTANTSLATALNDEPWDYISFQQASPNSGQYSTYTTPLPLLYTYVKQRATNPQVKYILHQTWAYAQHSTHEGFVNYNRDQMTMYNAIVHAVTQAKDLINADIIVPSGTAIQNGRTSLIGDNFDRDGYHLDVNIGRYTAACTWFETIFDKNVIGNLYKPSALSDYEAEIAKHAAHFAVLKPQEITEMVDYQVGGGSGILANPVFIGFGYTEDTPGWNGFMGASNSSTGTSIVNLKDDKNIFTGVSITIVEGFRGRNQQGEKGTNTDFNMPDHISSYSYFGNSYGPHSGETVEKSVLKLSGLDKDKKYDICFFGSRSLTTVDNREAKYISKGKNEVITYLDATNNKSKTSCTNAVQPNDTGEIEITITAGDNNNNPVGYFYINAMRISSSAP